MPIYLGILETDPAPLPGDGGAEAARYAEVLLLPDDGSVSARVANVGQGDGRGLFVPHRAGDEVVVLVPELGRQAAVILGGLANAGASPDPQGNDGSRAMLLHEQEVVIQVGETGPRVRVSEDGIELYASDGEGQPVVLADLLTALKSYTEVLDAFILACSTAVTAPNVAAAAALANTAIEAGQFSTKLGTSYRASDVKAR